MTILLILIGILLSLIILQLRMVQLNQVAMGKRAAKDATEMILLLRGIKATNVEIAEKKAGVWE